MGANFQEFLHITKPTNTKNLIGFTTINKLFDTKLIR